MKAGDLGELYLKDTKEKTWSQLHEGYGYCYPKE